MRLVRGTICSVTTPGTRFDQICPRVRYTAERLHPRLQALG